MGGPDVPAAPDPNQAAQAGAIADVGNTSFRQLIDFLAQTGGKQTVGGKTYDFTGLGTADQNATISKEMAQAMLDIQKGYGPAYIKQRLADLQQSDPAGYAARKQMFDRILTDAEANPDRPMAADLQQQVMGLLGQSSNLSTGPASETEAVQQGVRGQQLSNGIFLGKAPASQEASAVVNAGDAMQKQRQGTATNFMNSGVSAENVKFRRIEQSLSNLANAASGQTPEAQFSSLSGAQNGAAPFNTGNVQTATVNQNAGLQGIQNAADIYSGQVNWASKQVNPWTVGLSTAAGATSALNSMGAFSRTATASGTGNGFGILPSGQPASANNYANGMVAG